MSTIFMHTPQLTLILEEQLEGGYTITCKELPELLTECDSLDEMKDNVIDAFCAVKALYEYRQRPLPKEIQYTEDEIDETEQQLLHTVVAINEVSASHQKTEASWV